MLWKVELMPCIVSVCFTTLLQLYGAQSGAVRRRQAARRKARRAERRSECGAADRKMFGAALAAVNSFHVADCVNIIV